MGKEMVSVKNKVMLIYPPGKLYQRGEDRCQISIEDSTSNAMRACNDLGYCAAVLEKKGYKIFLMDYQTEKKLFDDVHQDIDRFQPDLIMISVTNATIFGDITFADSLHDLCDAVIVLKGAIFYAPPPEFLSLLDLKNIDYLIGGEAETCIVGIVDYSLRNEGTIEDANNIFYKDSNGNFVSTRFHCWMENLDGIPFPARQYMNNKLYTRPDTNEPMATIQTSRGCAASCIYCLSPQISGKNVRYRSPENVYAEIEECYYKFNIRNFFFKADTFTLNAKWTNQLCQMIISSPLYKKIHFTANSRTNPISYETLLLMKKAGCFAIAFGFESGSDETMERIKKGAMVKHNLQAAQWAREAGLPIFGFFIIGFPWETKEHLELTRKHIFDIMPDFLEVAIALPYHGTELYKLCKDSGTLENGSLGTDIYLKSGVNGTCYLSQKELLAYRNWLLKAYCLRPSYILRRLKDCIYNPLILLNYAKYGLRMIKNTNR